MVRLVRTRKHATIAPDTHSFPWLTSGGLPPLDSRQSYVGSYDRRKSWRKLGTELRYFTMRYGVPGTASFRNHYSHFSYKYQISNLRIHPHINTIRPCPLITHIQPTMNVILSSRQLDHLSLSLASKCVPHCTSYDSIM